MNTNRISILIVDDDEDDFILVEDMLDEVEHTSFDLTWTQFYDDGLQLLAKQKFDLCLVDYHLGEENGIEVIKSMVKV